MLDAMVKATAIKLSEEDDGRILDLRPGQELELKLSENPTTGYRWRAVMEGKPVFELVKSSFAAGRKPGEPGVHIRRYRIARAGKATLKLVYRRAWDSPKSAEQTFRLRARSRASNSKTEARG